MRKDALNDILVVGFPYVRERYFATWRHVPEPGRFWFLLPSRWTAKQGKVVFRPPNDRRIKTTRALFPYSHVPILGGLLKGWMPMFPLHLWHLRRQVSLVYACSEPTALTALWFAFFTKLFGKKLVLFSWENISYDKKLHGISHFIHILFLRINLALTDGLICGNLEGERIHRAYTRKPIAIIPMNGVDPKQFKPDASARAHSPFLGRFVYTFIGALDYRKGLDVLIQAFARVRDTVPDAHLVIAGSGGYEMQLEQAIEAAGIRRQVTRFPWLDHHEMVRLLSVSHAFIYPSISYRGWAEQFGYSMAEASLMELPVITTRSGSIPEVVQDGETGILTPPGDVAALATAMLQLRNNEDFRRRLGAAGRRYIAEHYSHAIVARRFSEFLCLVNQKSPQA